MPFLGLPPSFHCLSLYCVLQELVKTHSRMRGFNEITARQNYIRCAQKFGTYGYCLFPVKQTHLQVPPDGPCPCPPSTCQFGGPLPAQYLSRAWRCAQMPATILIGLNYKGLSVFRTDDKSKNGTYKYVDLNSSTFDKGKTFDISHGRSVSRSRLRATTLATSGSFRLLATHTIRTAAVCITRDSNSSYQPRCFV